MVCKVYRNKGLTPEENCKIRQFWGSFECGGSRDERLRICQSSQGNETAVS